MRTYVTVQPRRSGKLGALVRSEEGYVHAEWYVERVTARSLQRAVIKTQHKCRRRHRAEIAASNLEDVMDTARDLVETPVSFFWKESSAG